MGKRKKKGKDWNRLRAARAIERILVRLKAKPWTPERFIEIGELERALAKKRSLIGKGVRVLQQKQIAVARKKEKLGVPLTPYQLRDKLLRQNGFKTYGEYLESNLWAQIRQAVMARFRGCALCGGKKHHVHHTGYALDTLLGNALDQLVALCRDCHRRVEFDGKRKRTFDESTAEFALIRAEQSGTDRAVA